VQPRTCILSVTALTLGFVLVLGVPARAGDAIQFSCSHTFKLDENHGFPVGNDPDHMIGVFKSSGVNTSTSQNKFLDGATETEEASYDSNNKGSSSSHHGYILFTDAAGTMLNEFSGHGTVVTIDGKPYSIGVGSWHMVRGTGRYANGYGVGSYRSKLTLPNFEGTTEWDGTFTAASSEAANSQK
jgi:hypothetical protein